MAGKTQENPLFGITWSLMWPNFSDSTDSLIDCTPLVCNSLAPYHQCRIMQSHKNCPQCRLSSCPTEVLAPTHKDIHFL
ncbi:hypothetical protein BDA96_02G172000 [Sorghum bicolor]|uniref:Uncharacterized protein n=2 Tax=Sorghum bicolor TaxID=4558 RepID=A0A921RN89_SORBI|nr:hypothetical protein BDA96_02G172000 [Sorghum bicolor]KXG35368.1 hypothetical protein SORBI_3002G165200 [Sorghum bicolor]